MTQRLQYASPLEKGVLYYKYLLSIVMKKRPTNEEKVMRWVAEHDVSPLNFGDKRDVAVNPWSMKRVSQDPPVNTKDIPTMVNWVINQTSFRPTYFKNGELQCKGATRRSVVDIWRIILHYNKKADLFEIMRYLYSDPDHRFMRQFCYTIDQRVFRTYSGESNRHDGETDEFGLEMDDWEKIGL